MQEWNILDTKISKIIFTELIVISVLLSSVLKLPPKSASEKTTSFPL
jgi:hypothetical protein